MSCLTSAAARVLLTLALPLGAGAASAQSAQPARGAHVVPDRPRLKSDADTNDWRSYYTEGFKHLRRTPDRSIGAFYWAARLNPVGAEPRYAQWLAEWKSKPQLFQEYLAGAKYVIESGEGQRIDSLYYQALLRNPLVDQRATRWLYEGLPGVWPDDPYVRGILAYSENRFDEALKQFAKAAPKSPDAHYARALTFTAMKQYDSATAELATLVQAMRQLDRKRLTSFYESTAMYEFGAATLYANAGKLDEARAAYGRALAEDLTLYMAHAGLAEVERAIGDSSAALSEYATAVELRPDDGALRFSYATALQWANHGEEAVAQYAKAIELEPYFAGSYFNLAVLLDADGQGPRAARLYDDFVRHAPATGYETQIQHANKRIASIR